MKYLFLIFFFHSCTTTTNEVPGKRPNKADTSAFQALSYTSDLAKLTRTVDAQKIQILELQKSQKKDSTNILLLTKTVNAQAAQIKKMNDSAVFLSPLNFLIDKNRVVTIKK